MGLAEGALIEDDDPNLKLSKDGLKIRTTIWLHAQFGYFESHTDGLTIGPVAVGYIATASLIE